ncbi:MAG TPA: AAA family ATPase [Bryobacteraceae bacterium]|nr:AAA family ATPase [Bryobacteraceae bacterium]
MIRNFYGNAEVVATLEQMLAGGRLQQTLLLAGPEGVGKATLARRFAGALLGEHERLEQDDLSLESNVVLIADREKWPSEKRVDDPLLFASHPDFLTFPPDGPLRQISIQQIRLLKERAQYKPLRGGRRVFFIDHLDRANEQAANSLLKVMEEPPEHLILIATAENVYDLLPTIRSRSVILHLNRLNDDEMASFVKARGLDQAERRLRLAEGSPGIAVSLDLAAYDKRRNAMLVLLQVAAKLAPFSNWVRYSEQIGASKSDKLDAYLKVLYTLFEDLLWLQLGRETIRNVDVKKELRAIAEARDFTWIQRGVRRVDEIVEFVRRNIQKSIALDALIVHLQTH